MINANPTTKQINKQEFDLKIDKALLRILKVETEELSHRPYLVFLHDSLGCISTWRDFPEKLALSSNCNLIVYDRIGYGKSSPFSNKVRGNDYLEKEADILYEVLNTLNINSSILFGHSDGASIALIAASKYGEIISGVITEGAHVFVEEITLSGIREAVTNYRTTKLRHILEKYHFDKTDDVFNAWTKIWLSEGFRNWNIESFLPKIKCPLLVIQGKKDEYGTEHQVNSIVNKSSGKSLKLMIPNVKHTPHKEVPELIYLKSKEFIDSLGIM